MSRHLEDLFQQLLNFSSKHKLLYLGRQKNSSLLAARISGCESLRIELEGNDAHASDFKDKDGIIAQRPVFKSSVKSGKNSIVL
jgi:hypothetical protein